MATFSITINEKLFGTERTVVETSCATVIQYDIFSSNGDDIDITLSGEAVDGYVNSNGIIYPFVGTITGLTFDTSMSVHFIIENSGSAGVFYTGILVVENNTIPDNTTIYEVRQNDTTKCPKDPFTSGMTVDTDTITADNTLITADNG